MFGQWWIRLGCWQWPCVKSMEDQEQGVWVTLPLSSLSHSEYIHASDFSVFAVHPITLREFSSHSSHPVHPSPLKLPHLQHSLVRNFIGSLSNVLKEFLYWLVWNLAPISSDWCPANSVIEKTNSNNPYPSHSCFYRSLTYFNMDKHFWGWGVLHCSIMPKTT